MKSIRIRSYSGPYFLAFKLKTDKNNSKYGHFLRSERDNNAEIAIKDSIHRVDEKQVSSRKKESLRGDSGLVPGQN